MGTPLNPTTSISQNGFDAPIGAQDENIYLYDKDGEYVGTLHDLYENWADFKAKNNFTFTGSLNPAGDPGDEESVDVEQIKVWYQTYN